MSLFFQFLKRNTSFGFKIIPLTCLLCYFSILYLSDKYFGSYSVLANYIGLFSIPYFLDLKILLCGIDSIRNHQNPYDFCHEIGHFNYPIVWMIFTPILFFSYSNYFLIGIGLIILFYFLVFQFIGKINLIEAIIYSLFFISPSTMLLLERGNSDIIIFILMLLMLHIKNNVAIQTTFLLIISMLKLFPIGAIIMLFVHRITNRKMVIILSVFAFLFSLYVYLFFDNIRLVSFLTPRPYGAHTYGLGGIPSLIFVHFNQFKLLIFISFMIGLFIWLVFFYKKIKPLLNKMTMENGLVGNAFFMGAGIFILTCLIGFNWEYRLTFLFFTLPQILAWVKQKMLLSYFVTGLLLLVVWQNFISGVIFYFFNFRFYEFFAPFFVVFLFSYFLSVVLHNVCLRFFVNRNQKLVQ